MGFRFQRRIRLLPGIRLNLSKGGISMSLGRRGAWATFGRGRQRTSVGLPGTGLSYTETSRSEAPAARGGRWWIVLIALAVLGWALRHWA